MTIEALQTERLALVPVTADHAQAFAAVMSGAEMGRHTDVPAQPSAKQAQRFVAWMEKLNSSGKGRAWAIELRCEAVGFLRFNRIDKRASTASIGYEVAQPASGQGYASEALAAAVRFAHSELALHRLEAWVLDGNPASGRVLVICDFFLTR